jgi:pyridoxine 4-dehydrogenase
MTAAHPELLGRIALGTASMAIDEETRDRDADLATIRAGLDAGIHIVDTARAYARSDDPLSGERLAADGVDGRDGVVVMTKGGHWRENRDTWKVDNHAERLRRDAKDSLRALGKDRLDVYLLHRTDDVGADFDESLDALLALREDGVADLVGLSNASAEQLDRAVARGAVDVVQNPHGIVTRDIHALAVAEAHGIPYFGYSPLRTRGVPIAALFPHLDTVATDRGLPLARLVLRGLLAESQVLSLVSGATRAESVRDSAAAEREPWDSVENDSYRLDIDQHKSAAGGRLA